MDQSAGAKKAAKKTTGKKKLNGFMKFLSEKREDIKKMMPNAKVHEVAKKAGEMWRKLSENDKKKYK